MIYILHLGILLAQIGYDFLNDLDTQVGTSEDNSFEEFYNSLYVCVVFVAFYCPFVQKSYWELWLYKKFCHAQRGGGIQKKKNDWKIFWKAHDGLMGEIIL